MSMLPSERALIGRLAAHSRWSKTSDRAAATQPARDGHYQRFVREVDPDGILSPDELARRVESARSAYFSRLALKSAVARRKSKEHTAAAEQADRQLSGLGGVA